VAPVLKLSTAISLAPMSTARSTAVLAQVSEVSGALASAIT